MKGIRTILICVGVLALVAFCVAVIALPSVTLYEAKSDAYSYNQVDPSIKDLKTTEGGEQLLALMDRLDTTFGEIAVAIRYVDPVYLNEMIAKFNNTYLAYGSTLKSLNIPKSDLDSYYQIAYRVNASGTNLSNYYPRFSLLLNDLEFRDDIRPDFTLDNLDNIVPLDTVHNQEILAELTDLSEEIMPHITVLHSAAQDMAEIVEKFGLSTSKLDSVGPLLTEYIVMLGSLFGENTWQNIWQNVWQDLHDIDIESNLTESQIVPREENNENNKENFWHDVIGIDIDTSWNGASTVPGDKNSANSENNFQDIGSGLDWNGTSTVPGDKNNANSENNFQDIGSELDWNGTSLFPNEENNKTIDLDSDKGITEGMILYITILHSVAQKIDEIAEKLGISTSELNSVESLLTEYFMMLGQLFDENNETPAQTPYDIGTKSGWNGTPTVFGDKNNETLEQILYDIGTKSDWNGTPIVFGDKNNETLEQILYDIGTKSGWNGTPTIPKEDDNETIIIDSDIGMTEDMKKNSLLFYGFVLLAILGAGGVLIWRNVLKRKAESPDEIVEFAKSSSYAESTVQNEDDNETVFAEVEPDILPPVAIYPQGIDSIEDIRDIYRCVIHAVADKCDLDHVDVLTPYEVVRESGIVQLMPFIEEYVYLQYGASSVSADDLRKLKTMAKNLENIIQKKES